ncbi:MAG: hypothetical protein HY648_13675 [Acidobacteria bacterium]|nr:hypothetical protein [Acidobacteriota bacterium]
MTKPDGKAVPQALSCKLMVEEGLQVHELSEELTWNLRRLFTPNPEEASQNDSPA